MIGNELDAIRELLIGVAQQFRHDWPRGSAVLQSRLELLPSDFVDADGVHVGVHDPPLPILLPSHLDSAHQNPILEARAVQALAEHLTDARGVCVRERAGPQEAQVDGGDLMGPDVGVGWGVELGNWACPIGASADGTDRQSAGMVGAVALEERATDVGQAWQQHFEAVIIQLLGLASRLLPGPLQWRSDGRGRRTRTRRDGGDRAMEWATGGPAPAQGLRRIPRLSAKVPIFFSVGASEVWSEFAGPETPQ